MRRRTCRGIPLDDLRPLEGEPRDVPLEQVDRPSGALGKQRGLARQEALPRSRQPGEEDVTVSRNESGEGLAQRRILVEGWRRVRDPTRIRSEVGTEDAAELRALRDQVVAMRGELERAIAGRDEAIARAAAQARGEIAQLQATIVALREELERARPR